MAGASVETTLELWASSLREVKARMRPLFSQQRVARSAGQFLDGLLSNEPRKTGWMRGEAAGDPGPWRQQALLVRGQLHTEWSHASPGFGGAKPICLGGCVPSGSQVNESWGLPGDMLNEFLRSGFPYPDNTAGSPSGLLGLLLAYHSPSFT